MALSPIAFTERAVTGFRHDQLTTCPLAEERDVPPDLTGPRRPATLAGNDSV